MQHAKFNTMKDKKKKLENIQCGDVAKMPSFFETLRLIQLEGYSTLPINEYPVNACVSPHITYWVGEHGKKYPFISPIFSGDISPDPKFIEVLIAAVNNTAKFINEHIGGVAKFEEFNPIHYVRQCAHKMPNKRTHIYLIHCDETKLTKIGESENPKVRLRQLEKEHGNRLELLFQSVVCFAQKEADLHKQFSLKREFGEWFRLNERDIDYIKNYNFKTL